MDSQDTQSRPADDRSLGELVASATRDLSQLVHKEVELAKVEIKKDIAAAGKGAGLFGGAGLTGLFALFFLSFALVYGISGLGLDLGWAFLIVGLAYLAAARSWPCPARRRSARWARRSARSRPSRTTSRS
jgi:hypothetical protein